MADVSELIQRKVERVAKYRNAQDAIDYFHFVDLPSIKKHINNFWQNVDLAIENTFSHPRGDECGGGDGGGADGDGSGGGDGGGTGDGEGGGGDGGGVNDGNG